MIDKTTRFLSAINKAAYIVEQGKREAASNETKKKLLKASLRRAKQKLLEK